MPQARRTGIPSPTPAPLPTSTSAQPATRLPSNQPTTPASLPKPEDVATKCDFSELWPRIAYAWLVSQSAPDVSLLGVLSELLVPEGPCPNATAGTAGEKPTTTRQWFCLANPRTGGLVEDLTVCSDCVARVDTILPRLRGVWGVAAGGAACPATCDLMVPGHDRSVRYVDQLIEVAEKTLKSGYRDLTPAIVCFEKYALVPECARDGTVKGRKCFSMGTTVPEFTVCEECFLVVQPELEKASPATFATYLGETRSIPFNGFACQLYSPRTRDYRDEALKTGDVGLFKQKIVTRLNKHREITQKLEPMNVQYQQQKMQAQYHMQSMLIKSKSAMHHTLMVQMYHGAALPTDLRQTNAMMHQGSQMEMQAVMTLDNMRMLENEWKTQWE